MEKIPTCFEMVTPNYLTRSVEYSVIFQFRVALPRKYSRDFPEFPDKLPAQNETSYRFLRLGRFTLRLFVFSEFL